MQPTVRWWYMPHSTQSSELEPADLLQVPQGYTVGAIVHLIVISGKSVEMQNSVEMWNSQLYQ